MDHIVTTVPLPMSDIRTLITTPGTVARIRYVESRLKDRAFLIYCTNANVPVEIDVSGCDSRDVMQLVHSYITLKSALVIPSLIHTISDLLLTLVGNKVAAFQDATLLPNGFEDYVADDARRDALIKMGLVLSNLTTFVACCNTTIGAETKAQVGIINDIDFTGTTFVHLIKQEGFLEAFLDGAPLSNVPLYFSQQYDEYIFSGQNLYKHIEATPLMATARLTTSAPEIATYLSALAQVGVPNDITVQ